MLGTVAPYVVAISAMLFAACSALALSYAARHLDPPEARTPAPEGKSSVAV